MDAIELLVSDGNRVKRLSARYQEKAEGDKTSEATALALARALASDVGGAQSQSRADP
jgi:hypothetical protein